MNKCLYCYQLLEAGQDFHLGCSKNFFGTTTAPSLPYSLDQMNELAKLVIERSVAVPGVQAKLSLTAIKDTLDKSTRRLTVTEAMGGLFILKPPSSHYPELPQNEHFTMRLAEIFGIRVVPSTLIRLASGELAYLTRRVDRTKKGEKIHMLDMYQITEAFDKYKSSMEKVGKALLSYSANPMLDSIFLFELTLFCFVTGNNDMHLKNFSMIEHASGWVMAPAYDLLNVAIANPADDEELALTLLGKKKKLKREHFEQFGQKLELTSRQIEAAFQRFEKKLADAKGLIESSLLSPEMQEAYAGLLAKRAAVLFPR